MEENNPITLQEVQSVWYLLAQRTLYISFIIIRYVKHYIIVWPTFQVFGLIDRTHPIVSSEKYSNNIKQSV